MANLAEEGSRLRRVTRPNYDFDPDAVYPDPHAQVWATYYAESGLDPAGAIYSTFVSNLENRSDSFSQPTLTINTSFLEKPSASTHRSVQPEPEDFDYLCATYGISVTLPSPTSAAVIREFRPTRPDELALQLGDKIYVIHTFKDGWSFVKKANGEEGRGVVPNYCLAIDTDFIEEPSAPTPNSVQPEPEGFDYLRATYGISMTLPINTTVKYDFKPSHSDEVAVKGGDSVYMLRKFDDGCAVIRKGAGEGEWGVVPADCLLLEDTSPILKLPGPRTPSSLPCLSPVRSPNFESREVKNRKSKRNVLGLLEPRKSGQRAREDDSIPSSEVDPPIQPKSELIRHSVLKKGSSTSNDGGLSAADEPPGLTSQSTHRVRFDPSKNLEFQFSTYDKSSISSAPRWDTISQNSEEEDEFPDPSSISLTNDTSFPDSPTLPSPNLSPSYKEVNSLANTASSVQKSLITSSASYDSSLRLGQLDSTPGPAPVLGGKVSNAEVYTQPVLTDIRRESTAAVQTLSTVAVAQESVLSLRIIYRVNNFPDSCC
ncbi:hypothetical protein VKT23_017919 [Stygiomarasmius scandens]|uniref:SH3 domain-containing protein n=1 Tax=Marasmiellus scandens TaxID=2682957 RepID=A0ABR1ITI5_9AGAR